MGNFWAMLLLLSVVGVGMNTIVSKFKRKPRKAKTAAEANVVKDAEEVVLAMTPALARKVYAMAKTLSVHGYAGEGRVRQDQLIYVDDPVLSAMIEEVDRELRSDGQGNDLRWVVPHLRMRIVAYDPARWGHTTPRVYTHVLLTPTHGVGFNLEITENRR